MYNSNYSQAKFGLEARRKIQKPRGKSCGYYTRVVFFFSSLIQSLIIVSLVLFLVYGRSPDSAAESRVQDLEKSFNRLSIDNMNLRQQKKNLTLLLNATQTEKMRNSKDMINLRQMANKSVMFITNLRDQANQCDNDKRSCQIQLSMNRCPRVMTPITTLNGNNNNIHENQVQRLEQLLKLVSTNFSQTVQFMRIEIENTAKDRDTLTLDAISLRRDKTSLLKQLESYRKKCKEDFIQSLSGISKVSKAFLLTIDTLLPKVSPFLINCEKQRDYLDQIRNNCSSLSREVETKFQHYLDNVGSQVSEIQGRSARLQAEKDQLVEDHHWCSQNRSAMALEHQEKLQKTQEKYDQEMEKLLTGRMRLQGDKDLGETAMKVKEGEIKILNDKIRSLNASLANCGSRTGMGSPGATGNTGTGWVGSSATGQGNRGSIAGTGLMAGIGGWGASASATGNSNTVFGNTGMGGAGSSATGVGTRGSGGTGLSGAGSPSGVAKKIGPGLGSPNSYSLANINQYLRELQQYSKPNSGSEVSG
ncbi:plasmalemma vesicle-associated protein-like [Salvelinus fontinalis]|uniref:plasmalemma vesicle-associated protein-like n=1 Tax=Salvelinus fontinalis TaxID=8038 RepID=UPI002486501B|nr:plasmalemma vesicle-associated protein-like [Salvelinus fontinalis]